MVAAAISPFNVFLMLCLITFWGSSFVVVKLLFPEALTPISIATFRFLVASAMFLIGLLFKKSSDHAYKLRVDMKDVPTLLVVALMGVTFFFIAQYTGIQLSSASLAAILVCLLSPILITILSAQMLREHLGARQLVGIGISGIGTATVIGSS